MSSSSALTTWWTRTRSCGRWRPSATPSWWVGKRMHTQSQSPNAASSYSLSLSLLHIVVNVLQVAAGLNIDSAASVRSMGVSTSESDLMISNCENYSKLSVSTFGGGRRPSQKAKEAGEERAPHLKSDCITCAQVRDTKLRHLTTTNSSLPSINTMTFCT